MKKLKKHFEKAGLLLSIAKVPFGRGNEQVFGITILRKLKGNTRTEYFSLWPGAEENRIEVVSIDPKRKQLVLMIHEQKREVYHHSLSKSGLPPGAKKITYLKNGGVDFVLETSSRKRHLLMGVDERQLFIAQLPRAVTTIDAAHKSLKTTSVTLAEGKVPGRTVRQGEWFFLNTSNTEQDAIKRAVNIITASIQKRVAIGTAVGVRNGNPHTADELIILPAPRLGHGHTVNSRGDIFVRGKIRHRDHKTVSFKTWRKVIRNAEHVDQAQLTGINWID